MGNFVKIIYSISLFKLFLFFTLIGGSFAINLLENEEVPEEEKAIFKILKGPYNKEIRPPSTDTTNSSSSTTNKKIGKNRKPTKVKVNLLVRDIDKISDISMEITLQFTIRQIWTDRRLSYKMEDSNLEYITLYEETADKIWTPDLFFGNGN